MSLTGQRFGAYEVRGLLGAGGMGEVYRAHDSRLGRDVALKILPAAFTADSERLARFEREARVLAALNHPNIGAIYGLEDHDGVPALVLELVEGETLAFRIRRGPVPVTEALAIARQIAEALDAAHDKAIVHRDLKPANIKITPDGVVKVLDFGLAKAAGGDGAPADSQAPTRTLGGTREGVILGTAAYMSPEQARAQAVDKRTDIWAFGCVLYEMLTGSAAFGRDTITDTLAAIVERDPDWQAIPPATPPAVQRLLRRCLDKEAKQRLRDIGEARFELDAALAAASDRRAHSRLWVSATLAVAFVLVTALLLTASGAGVSWMASLMRALRPGADATPAPVIAVMPLEVADQSQVYFADGLTEDLITRLGQTPGLRVIGRSSTRAFRGRAPRDVASELGAAVVLTGSVRPQSQEVRVTLELIDPRDGIQMWAGQYTRELKDIFAVQAQMAEEIAAALRVTLQPTDATRRAAGRLVNAQAYTAYLRGREASAERRVPDAIALFEQAIAADDSLAEAFAGLAEALHLDGVYDTRPDHSARLQRIRAAAERAYRLDPDLPQANVAMGLATESLAGALAHLRRAIQLDPSYTEAYHLIGDEIQDFDPRRSIAFFQKSLEFDPRLDAINKGEIAISLALLDRPDEARQILATERPNVTDETARAFFLVWVELDDRRYDRALQIMDAHPDQLDIWSRRLTYAAALRSAGRATEALAEAMEVVRRFPEECAARAILAGLTLERGDRSAAGRLAEPILSNARSEASGPPAIRCAALASAAMGDANQLAAWLDRIASREVLVRGWSLAHAFSSTGRMMLRGGSYPWSQVVNQPAVAAAQRRLDAAYARQREVAAMALAGLLDR